LKNIVNHEDTFSLKHLDAFVVLSTIVPRNMTQIPDRSSFGPLERKENIPKPANKLIIVQRNVCRNNEIYFTP